jgi:hypothetical protein
MRVLTLLLPLLLLAGTSSAQNQREVDLELFLAVDVSRSMSPSELEIQRKGYAQALSSDEVIARITGGLIGEIALTYVEWAGAGTQNVVVPWTLIDGPEAAKAVAEQITNHFDPSLRRTSISGALLYAQGSIASNEYQGLRRVIDISGDGPNNQGLLATVARDRLLADGLIINGLPLMTQDAFSERWGIPDLDIYYENCVIGGPGAFVLPVLTWDAFQDAVKRKLLLEIAGALPPRPLQPQKVAGYNCRIGEEIWERNMRMFSEP